MKNRIQTALEAAEELAKELFNVDMYRDTVGVGRRMRDAGEPMSALGHASLAMHEQELPKAVAAARAAAAEMRKQLDLLDKDLARSQGEQQND